MNLCCKGHQEICFEGRYCPACELVSEIESLKKEMSDHVCEVSND